MEKTVTTLLYDGKSDGPQMSILVGTSCLMYVISRQHLDFIATHDAMKNPALYVLIGSKNGSPAAYVGQTDDFSHRIKDHDYKKPFWTTAIAFMREGSPMTSNEIKYLEFLGYEAALKAGNYSTEENKQNIRKPTLRPWDEAPIRSFFEDCRFLADFRGYHVFSSTKGPKPDPMPVSNPEPVSPHKLFTLQCKSTLAKGYVDGEGFVVVKGSRIDPSVTQYLIDKHKDQDRQDTLSRNATLADGVWVLDKDVRFDSVNKAAMFCVAGSINALKAWKDDDGRPLGDFIRNKEQS